MTNQTQSPQLFNSPTKANGTVAEAAVARAAQEVQAAMVVAKKFPRDENLAFERILRACKRKTLAECACYVYPRGGQTVTGPSIRLAECLAQNWGNMDFGVVELDQRDGESQVMAYAWDLETNTRQTKIFNVKHERRKGKENIPLEDPRDIYEMVANNGARRLRACILGVIPGDVVDAAVDECEKTMKSGAKEPLADRVRKMAAAFSEIGVTHGMIEARLGHNLDATSEQELVNLRKIYTSLRDGMGKREDWFKPEPVKPQFEDPGDDSDLAPAKNRVSVDSPKQPENPQSSGRVQNLPKAIRGLLKLSGHTEVELLDLLRSTGQADESLSGLEEIAMVAEPTLRKIHDTWQQYSAQLAELKGKAAK